MKIAKEYKKNTITGQMIYPCEMYQTPTETEQITEENKEHQTEQNKEHQTEQKAGES